MRVRTHRTGHMSERPAGRILCRCRGAGGCQRWLLRRSCAACDDPCPWFARTVAWCGTMGKASERHAVSRLGGRHLALRRSRRYFVDKVIEESRMSVLAATADIETSTMRRVSWRLMPFLLLAYLICYIDRVNIGFAALQMNKAVGIDPKTYGLGAGIFFVGYFFLEVPSNLALERFGARTWIARIMITWGLVSAAFALIGGPISFLVLRFLLGAAEAGFFPGVILYITYWYPAHYRAIIVGIFMVAIPVAGVIGSPLSGGILYMDGFLGLGGWQWIFLLEAAPAVLLGIASFVWLTDRPEHAGWLTRQQQDWLVEKLDAE